MSLYKIGMNSFLAATLALLSLPAIATAGGNDTLTFGKGEVVLHNDADEAMGKKLGKYLLDIEYFDHETRKSVVLDRFRNNPYTLKFIVKEIGWTDPEYVAIFNRSKYDLQVQIFNGEDFRMELCDVNLKLQRIIDGWGRQVNFGQGELFVTNRSSAGENTIDRLGNFLLDIEFFNEDEVRSAQLDERNDEIILRLVVVDEAFTTNQFDEGLRSIHASVESEVFDGKSIRFELCDTDLVTRRVMN